MKIITALANETINEKMKEQKLEIVGKDIQYQEALLEILEKNEIDLLILNSSLPGEMDIYELINIIKYKYKKIEIIIILENKNNQYIEFFIKKGINHIFINNQITEEELIHLIKEKQKNPEILVENEKTIITKNKIKILQKIKQIKLVKKTEMKETTGKIITIIGSPKVGKSIFTILLTLNIKDKKILLVELNSEKNDIKTILGKKENDEKILINKNVELLDKSNLTNYYFKEYDYVIIEIDHLQKAEDIIKKSNLEILLVEPNLIGIKETSKILETLVNQWNIDKNKIKIVFNKVNIFSFKKEVLKQIFQDFEILESLENKAIYNLLMNTNLKKINLKINKKYKQIAEKLLNKN